MTMIYATYAVYMCIQCNPSCAEETMVDLKQTLSRFLSIPGVRQAILVGLDGLLIEGLTRDGKDDMEAVGAHTPTGQSTAEALGQQISQVGSLSGLVGSP